MSELDDLFRRYAPNLPDFWERRANQPRFRNVYRIWGREIVIRSNHRSILEAMDQCAPLYSIAPPDPSDPFDIQLVVQSGPRTLWAPPEDLIDHVFYAGEAHWMMVQLGRWGHCFLDSRAGRAKAVLTPELAERPDLVSRCLLNTVITNFNIGAGYALLHASCLVRDGRALLLMAPHNAGKSTTSLRLALAGYRILTDSMVFLGPDADPVQLLGFSVGRLKLRPDMLDAFPQFRSALEVEYVRGERKHALDLRKHAPELIHERGLKPSSICIMLLARNGRSGTHIEPLARQELWDAVMENSLFYDTADIWRTNLLKIDALMQRAELFRLSLGSDAEGIVAAIDQLWTSSD